MYFNFKGGHLAWVLVSRSRPSRLSKFICVLFVFLAVIMICSVPNKASVKKKETEKKFKVGCPFWYASVTGAAGVKDNTSYTFYCFLLLF